jgi:hypothetical protein
VRSYKHGNKKSSIDMGDNLTSELVASKKGLWSVGLLRWDRQKYNS